MKQLTCEMCESTDFVKQDGAFVCQGCGMKYSLEEAKKMMAEATETTAVAPAAPAAAPADSAAYERVLELARDAYNDKRFDSAYDYYCQAVDMQQNVIENVLRQGLSILGKDGIKSEVPSSCVNRVVRAIELIQQMPAGEEKNTVILGAMEDVTAACSGARVFLQEEIRDLEAQKMKTRSASDILADLGRPAFVASQNQAEDKRIERHNSAINEKISAVRRRVAKIDEFETTHREKMMECADVNTKFKYFYTSDLSKAVQLYPQITLTAEEQKAITLKNNKLYNAASNKALEQVKMLIQMGADVNKKTESGLSPLFAVTAFKCTDENREVAIQIVKLLLENGAMIDGDEHMGTRTFLNTDSDEQIKNIIIEKDPNMANKITEAPQPKSGCCYVATAVYGSYDCPEVWTLRRFRDDTLAQTWYGRAFVHTYYAISPTLVKWFGHTEWFKKMWRGTLDRMVAKLQSKGVEATPYTDRQW